MTSHPAAVLLLGRHCAVPLGVSPRRLRTLYGRRGELGEGQGVDGPQVAREQADALYGGDSVTVAWAPDADPM